MHVHLPKGVAMPSSLHQRQHCQSPKHTNIQTYRASISARTAWCSWVGLSRPWLWWIQKAKYSCQPVHHEPHWHTVWQQGVRRASGLRAARYTQGVRTEGSNVPCHPTHPFFFAYRLERIRLKRRPFYS